MYHPFAFEHLVHPKTTADGHIRHPFRVASRNSLAGLVPVLIAASGYLWKYQDISAFFAWWWLALVPAGVVTVAFAHASLGAFIGGRRANNLFIVMLLIVLVGGCWFLARRTRGDA